MDDSPSSMKLWKNKLFFIDRKAIPDYLTWMSTKSFISNDFPTNGYDPNDLLKLYAQSAKLCDVTEVVLVRFGLSSIWLNQKCDLVLGKKDDNSSRDAEVIKEPHEFVDLIMHCIENHTTTIAAEGTPIPKPTPKEITASPSNPKVAKKLALVLHDFEDTENADQGNDISEAAYYRYLESSLEKDKGISSRTTSVQSLRSGTRLGAPPPYDSNASLFGPDCVSTSHAPNAPSYFDDDAEQGTGSTDAAEEAHVDEAHRAAGHIDLLGQSALGHDNGLPSDDDFSFPTLGQEIELKLFPLTPRPYYIPSSYAKDIDRTITLAKLKRTEAMSPLELSIRMNVLTSLIVSHGIEMNVWYTSFAISTARLQEKVKVKMG
ncbi:hypothetical protein Tco_0643729 [Tanacetum coccineum]